LFRYWIHRLFGAPALTDAALETAQPADGVELCADDHSLLTDSAATPEQVVPSPDELETIQPGDCIELRAGGHSFWVRIVGRTRDHLIGEFDTLPFPSMADPPFRAFYGTRIRFRPRHVHRTRPRSR